MKNLENIEGFFQRNLNESENIAFNTQLQENSEFQNQVAFYLNAKQLGNFDKKVKFDALGQAYLKTSNLVRSIGKFSAAAAILIAMFLFLNKNVQNQQINFAANYFDTKFGTLSTTMAGNASEIENGVAFYNAKKYKRAIEIFKKSAFDDPQALEFLGLSYLQNLQYDEASKVFEKLAENQNLVSNKGDFLNGITFLKKGERNKAKEIFEKIVNSNRNDIFGKLQSKQILEELK